MAFFHSNHLSLGPRFLQLPSNWYCHRSVSPLAFYWRDIYLKVSVIVFSPALNSKIILTAFRVKVGVFRCYPFPSGPLPAFLVLSLFMYGIFPLSHPAILHSFPTFTAATFSCSSFLLVLWVPLPGTDCSVWLIFNLFFFNAAGREYPYVVRFAMSLYHRLNFRAHHLWIYDISKFSWTDTWWASSIWHVLCLAQGI